MIRYFVTERRDYNVADKVTAEVVIKPVHVGENVFWSVDGVLRGGKVVQIDHTNAGSLLHVERMAYSHNPEAMILDWSKGERR